MFLAVILVPELLRKRRETPGNNFHPVSSKSKRGCPSYDQKADLVATLRRLIIVPGGLITSPRGGPGGPGTGFCSPGGDFSGNRCSGKPLRLLRLK